MRLAAATLLLVGAMTVSCADDASETSTDDKGSGGSQSELVNETLPDNLCDEVLPAVPVEYGVAEVSHDSTGSEASCSLASESGATTLDVTLTVTGADALDEAFATTCDDVVQPEPDGQQERRCTASTAGDVVQATSLATRSGVLVMRLTSDDSERIRTAGVDLALVESAVASA